MGHADYYAKGSYNVICDLCGQKFKRHECRMIKADITQKEPIWMACPACYHECNPQSLVTSVEDKQAVPIARPDHPPIFRTHDPTWEDF